MKRFNYGFFLAIGFSLLCWYLIIKGVLRFFYV